MPDFVGHGVSENGRVVAVLPHCRVKDTVVEDANIQAFAGERLGRSQLGALSGRWRGGRNLDSNVPARTEGGFPFSPLARYSWIGGVQTLLRVEG